MIRQGHATIDEFERGLRTLGLADVRLLVHRAAEQRTLVTAVVNAGMDTTAVAQETNDYGEVVFSMPSLTATTRLTGSREEAAR